MDASDEEVFGDGNGTDGDEIEDTASAYSKPGPKQRGRGRGGRGRGGRGRGRGSSQPVPSTSSVPSEKSGAGGHFARTFATRTSWNASVIRTLLPSSSTRPNKLKRLSRSKEFWQIL